jgi:hypothetical protein
MDFRFISDCLCNNEPQQMSSIFFMLHASRVAYGLGLMMRYAAVLIRRLCGIVVISSGPSGCFVVAGLQRPVYMRHEGSWTCHFQWSHGL